MRYMIKKAIERNDAALAQILQDAPRNTTICLKHGTDKIQFTKLSKNWSRDRWDHGMLTYSSRKTSKAVAVEVAMIAGDCDVRVR